MSTQLIHKLLIDDRERLVYTDHLPKFAGILHEIQRLTVGDYGVIDTVNNRLVAIFERKTYEDFGASLKDGRYDNKQKMLDVRAKTGCRLFYIIEGIPFPVSSKTFARIPYYVIESAIDHCAIRDGIGTIITRNPEHTAERLARFVSSMDRLYDKTGGACVLDCVDVRVDDDVTHISEQNIPATSLNVVPDIVPNASPMLSPNVPPPIDDQSPLAADEALKVKVAPPSDRIILRSIWSIFKGIGVTSADYFIDRWSIRDLLNGALVPAKAPAKSKLVQELSQKRISPKKQIKILSRIPGVGPKTAEMIIAKTNLKTLLSYEVDAIAIMDLTPTRKLGLNNARNIKRILEYSGNTEMPVNVPPVKQPTRVRIAKRPKQMAPPLSPTISEQSSTIDS